MSSSQRVEEKAPSLFFSVITALAVGVILTLAVFFAKEVWHDRVIFELSSTDGLTFASTLIALSGLIVAGAAGLAVVLTIFGAIQVDRLRKEHREFVSDQKTELDRQLSGLALKEQEIDGELRRLLERLKDLDKGLSIKSEVLEEIMGKDLKSPREITEGIMRDVEILLRKDYLPAADLKDQVTRDVYSKMLETFARGGFTNRDFRRRR